jgi:hypothetical protein
VNLRMVSPKSWGVLVLGVLALIVRIDERHLVSVNGVTECAYVDYAGIALGAIALIVGTVAVWEAVSGAIAYVGVAQRVPTFTVIVLGAALGVTGMLKGFAIIMSPCAGIT